MMGEGGVDVDSSRPDRWALKYESALEQTFLARKRPAGGSWLMDETCVRIKGAWKYLYRALNKAGATGDFLLTAKRDRKAALRFWRQAIARHAVPEKITIDKSGAKTTIVSYNANYGSAVEIRQAKFCPLKNLRQN
jgi:putative transposase